MPRYFDLEIVTRFIFKQFITRKNAFSVKIDKLRDINHV